jgi:MarR family transcriptional regulator for hemolysin
MPVMPDEMVPTAALGAPPREALRAQKKRAIAKQLTIVARQLWQCFDRSVELIGVSRAKCQMIAVVAARPGTTQRVIAEVLQVSEVTAGRLIDRLCADGYVERRENPTDRRAHCIWLTPAAQPILNRIGDLASTEEEKAFAGLGDDDLNKLETMLDVVAGNIAAAREQRSREPSRTDEREFATSARGGANRLADTGASQA